MRTLSLEAVVGLPAADTFGLLSDFARYPDYTDTVLAVDVEDAGPGRSRSAWEVTFRNGVLKWVEDEVADPAAGTIEFVAVDGDLERFEGTWRVLDEDAGTARVTLNVMFDSGLGTLADVVEPIAERTLHDNFATVLRALVGERMDVVA